MRNQEMTNIGFIGTGIMGRPMAGHLAQGKHRVVTFSRSNLPVDGCTSAQSIAELTAASDVIILMLPDTPDVAAVLFGDGGVAGALTKGKTVVDMSSISPTETKKFAARVRELGCDYLDAPVSGGQGGATDATLTIMVGGSQLAFERIKPLFELMGKTITLIGENGAGQTCKVANQIIVAATIEAVGEALLFASKAGADPAIVRQALLGGFASSRILEVHGERMIKRNFAAGFRVELHQKDLSLAIAGAKDLGISLPATSACQQLFNAVVAAGGAGLDSSAMVQALETLAAHQIAK
jgi:2-hydroxy-3-oxopropionate reductase